MSSSSIDSNEALNLKNKEIRVDYKIISDINKNEINFLVKKE